jgi:hypothetical protein
MYIMPANTKSTKTVETKKTEQPVATPAPAKKGGAKKVEEVAPVKEVAPTTTPTKKGGAKKVEEVAPVKEVAPTTTPAKKGGAKKTETAPAPVQAQATPAPTKKGGAKKAETAPAETPAPAKKGGAKKAAPKAKKAEAEDDASVEEKQGVRSFKVQLPGSEDYTGRFTGLTPYQAANKALSKFFRENKESNGEITFSIRESTRGSKRNVYSYNGKREKLAAPVKYSIDSKDATTGKAVTREIVKEYKNRLTKIKKAVAKEATA